MQTSLSSYMAKYNFIVSELEVDQANVIVYQLKNP